MGKTLNISIPAPHALQAEIEASPKKRILINAGRRAGKTFLVARIAVRAANNGSRVLYIAPTNNQTIAFWDLITDWLSDPILVGIVKKNETRRTADFLLTGGRIEARTGHKPDHLRGGYGDKIILDEYAYQNEEVLNKVCLPMVLDNDGSIIIISTPNLRNHFYHQYLRAVDSDDWDVFTFSSHDNPHLSKDALTEMVEDMLDVDYRQEILAEFVPGVGAVFTVRPEDFYTPNGKAEYKHEGHRLVGGLDWAQKVDYTALSIGCATCQKEIGIWRLKGVDYATQRDFIKEIIGKFEKVDVLAEQNSIGLPNIEQLWADGLSIIPFTTSNSSKAGIVQGLRLAFQQGSWKWVDDRDAWLELEAFEMKLSRSGLPTFSAPEGLHDDTVIARCLMLHQATIGHFTLG